MKFLDTEYVKSSLIISSLFLTGHELLKISIIDKLKGFLCNNPRITDDGELIHIENAEYKKLKSKKHTQFKNKANEYYSCCEWYKVNSVISNAELDILQKIIKHRNIIAHNLPEFILDDNVNLDIELLYEIQTLLTKIQKYWFLEFEVLVNPAFDNVIIKEDEATTPIISLMNYLIDVAKNEMEKLKTVDNTARK